MLIWFNPRILLVISEVTIMIIIKLFNKKLFIKIIIGAIFCHVNIIKQFIQFSPSSTSGNQAWKGAAPIFMKILVYILIIITFLGTLEICSSFVIIKIVENKKINEAITWVIKYFSAASAGNLLFVLVNSGMIDIRLISRPNHKLSQV